MQRELSMKLGDAINIIRTGLIAGAGNELFDL
mgnify:CR=1 FL=1